MRALVLGLTLLATGCSSNWQFDSNVDLAGYQHDNRATQVEIVTRQQLSDLDVQPRGAVSGESCQTDAQQPKASTDDALLALREQAFALEATTVVIDKCLPLNADESCLSSVMCFGQAFSVIADE